MKIAHSYPFVLSLLLIFAFLSNSSGQSNANSVLNDTPESLQRSKVDKLDELLNAYAEYGTFNGTVLVAHAGKVIYENAFGLANMEWEIPNQTDTKFRVASISKQFTAMLIMQLANEEKLKLDVPISAYLPEFPKRHGDSITIHQLLTHSSGIPNYTSFSNYREMMRKPMKPEEIIHAFADSSLQFKPGVRFDYSNSGYVLLEQLLKT